MPKFNDLTGKVFGRLVVIKRDENKQKRKTFWICQCNCDTDKPKIKSVDSYSLTSGHTQSCGCLQKEKSGMAAKEKCTTHGMRSKKIYQTHRNMINRCYNKKTRSYKDYGARGIKVCDEWTNKENGFINFYKWAMENGYTDELTIERINVNGNYEPSNCKWINNGEQARNKRNNIMVVYNNKEILLVKLLENLGRLNDKEYSTIYQRLFTYGWDINEALKVPIGKGINEYNNFEQSIELFFKDKDVGFEVTKKEIANTSNIPIATFNKYIKSVKCKELLDKMGVENIFRRGLIKIK